MIIIMSMKKRKIKTEPRIKLNHNIKQIHVGRGNNIPSFLVLKPELSIQPGGSPMAPV